MSSCHVTYPVVWRPVWQILECKPTNIGVTASAQLSIGPKGQTCWIWWPWDMCPTLRCYTISREASLCWWGHYHRWYGQIWSWRLCWAPWLCWSSAGHITLACDQANIAWFTSTRGVYQVWLAGRSSLSSLKLSICICQSQTLASKIDSWIEPDLSEDETLE